MLITDNLLLLVRRLDSGEIIVRMSRLVDTPSMAENPTIVLWDELSSCPASEEYFTYSLVSGMLLPDKSLVESSEGEKSMYDVFLD